MPNVIVTNTNEDAYERRFDGKLHSFPPNVPQTITEEAAAYLFGYGQDDATKKRIMTRNGWLRSGAPGMVEGGPDWAQKRLGAFIFKKAPEDAPAPKKAKVITKGVEEAVKRKAAGINAMSELADAGGNNKAAHRSTLTLPGKAERQSPAA